PAVRKPNGSGGSPTPPWLWLLLIALFGLIFWQFAAPKDEKSVSYSPWFLDQVEKDNIQNLSISGIEVHGELRKEAKFKAPSKQEEKVKKFTVNLPSDQAATPLAEKVRKVSREGKNEEARVEILQPQ